MHGASNSCFLPRRCPAVTLAPSTGSSGLFGPNHWITSHCAGCCVVGLIRHTLGEEEEEGGGHTSCVYKYQPITGRILSSGFGAA